MCIVCIAFRSAQILCDRSQDSFVSVCMYVSMVFADGVYSDKVFYAMASECICSSGKDRHGFVGIQLHQFV